MYRQIETERLRIRPITLNDKRFILALVNTKSWLQFIGDRRVKNEKDAEDYIKKIMDNDNIYYSTFEIKETRQPIGIITFIYRDNQIYPDIGFAMQPEFENKGYAFEACNEYINVVKNDLKEDKIIAITLPENTKSIKLLEKLGLKYEDNFIDNSQTLHLYSMPISNLINQI